MQTNKGRAAEELAKTAAAAAQRRAAEELAKSAATLMVPSKMLPIGGGSFIIRGVNVGMEVLI